MSLAATSKSAARGKRALILVAAALVAVAAAPTGGASAAATALCTTAVSAPTASPSSTTAGTPITFTATVTASAGCANGTPVGTVSFFSNYVLNGQPASFQLGSAVSLQPAATPGQAIATLTDNSLPAGSFAITASYTSGNEPLFYDSGPSAGTDVVVQNNALHTTVMTFTENPSTLVTGRFVTFHIQITAVDANGNPTGTIPTGTVHFSAGPTPAPSAQVHFDSETLDGTGAIDFSYGGFVPGDYVVIASYTGDPTDQGIFGQMPLTVLPAASPLTTATQIAYTGGTEAAAGTQATLSGHLTAGTGAALAGEPLTLTLGSQSCVTGLTDGFGNASCTITVAQSAGSHPVTARFLGDANWSASAGTASFTVDPTGTALAYTGARSAAYGGGAVLSATLKDAQGNPVGGETVHLAMGAQSCDAVTDASGDAGCTIAVSQTPGGYAASANFGGDATYSGSGSASVPFTVTAVATTTTYTGDAQDLATAAATLSAKVAPAPDGGTVTFTLGTQTCTAAAAGGVASCTIALDQPVGAYTVDVSYGGRAGYLASSTSAPFTIVSPATATHIAAIAPVAAGSPATLSATVSPPAASGTVTFSSGGTTLCTATLSGGTASCAASFAQSGSYPVTARYGGDGLYQPSSDGATALVYAFAPGAGTFVIGNRGTTGTVTFWGSQWSKVNALSGGAPPNTFKGYAMTLSAPSCGATWTTNTGSSSPPPAGPLPAYLAVVVTSSTTQSGSQVSGVVASIVVVKTNAGYANDSGHTGTGTVVATVCG